MRAGVPIISPPSPGSMPPGWRKVRESADGEAWIFEGRRPLDALTVIQSGEIHDGTWWHHVSFARPARMPSYEDMVLVKRLFIGPDKLALQLFVAESQHVNIHPYFLHLWHAPQLRLPDFTKGGGTI